MMASDDRDGRRAGNARSRDIIAKLSRKLRLRASDPPLPTAEEFEVLLNRFEREYTIAFHSWVWRTTWVEINELAERLFVDKGDLREFYACDYAVELILARNIPGVDDSIRNCMDGAGPLRTLESIATRYAATWRTSPITRDHSRHVLETLVRAYSPPETTRLQVLQRTMEVLRRAGDPLDEDHPVVLDWHYEDYRERAARYERETQRPTGSGAVTSSERFDEGE